MKTLTKFLATLLSIFFFAGCQDYLPLTGGEVSDGQTPPAASDFFSFNTTRKVSFSVDYGKSGGLAPIEVYTENPTYIDEDGNINFKGSPAFRAFCNAKGRYEAKVSLPTYVDKVWVYTMRMGVPQLLSADVKSNKVAVYADDNIKWLDGSTGYGYDPDEAKSNETFKEPYASSKVKEKVKDSEGNETGEEIEKTYKIWKAPKMANTNENLYSIVNWAGQRFGRITTTHFWDTKGNHYALENTEGTYDNQGLIDDLFLVVNAEGDPTVLGTADIDIIQTFLWGGQFPKPTKNAPKNYAYRPEKTKDINAVIPHTFIKDGELERIDSAQVWIRFLGEGAWNCDGLGYYYYKTNQSPDDGYEITNYYVAIPNTSSPSDLLNAGPAVPFRTGDINGGTTDDMTELGSYFDKASENSANYNYTFNPKFVPFNKNQRIQLLYHEPSEDGDPTKDKVSKYFPAGYTIGFFAFTSPTPKGGEFHDYPTMRIANGTKFHSDKVLNGGTKRYISLNYKDFAIYGVEDSNDGSLEDVVFAVETDPMGLVVNRNRVTIVDELHQATDEFHTYVFEDIWPDGGDYDLNDVVIEHYHQVQFTRDNKGTGGEEEKTSGKVTKIEDYFTPVHPGKTATYVDAFAIQLPPDRDFRTLTLYKNEVLPKNILTENKDYWVEEIDDKKNIILFNHIMQQQYQTVIVVREFMDENGNPIGGLTPESVDMTDDNGLNVFNPFIISQYDKKPKEGRVEIHLPNHEPTSLVDTTKGENYTGFDKDGLLFPFALSLPVGVVSGDESTRFIVDIENEGVRIDKIYPKFTDWVESKGERNQDWYLDYQPLNSDNDQENPSTTP